MKIIYVVTKYSKRLNRQLSPIGATHSMDEALYILCKRLNEGCVKEFYTMETLETVLNTDYSIEKDDICYSIYKTELY